MQVSFTISATQGGNGKILEEVKQVGFGEKDILGLLNVAFKQY